MEQIAEMYESGMSTTEVARSLGMPISAVRTFLLKRGLLRTRADAIKLAGEKGLLGSGMRGKTRVFSEEHKASMSKSRLDWADKNAVGTSLKKNGYIEYTRGENKGRSVHVVKMEERLGRRIKEDECVHHIDGNRSNNDENNLALMTREAHSRLHRFEDLLAGKFRERDENGRFS